MTKLEKEAEKKTAQYMAEHTEKYNCENTKLETDNYNTGREYGFEDGYLAAAEPREKCIRKAKDLIRRLITIYCDHIEYDEFGNTLEEARQFLEENK